MTTSIHGMIELWRSSNVALQAGLSAASVEAALTSVGRRVSSDVLALYELCNGMADDESDGGHMFSLSSVGQAVRRAPGFDSQFMPFADFLLSSHECCFRYESPQKSSVHRVGHTSKLEFEEVAGNVEEFFSHLRYNPQKVHPLLE